MPEEGKEQSIGNLFKNIIKENLPNLVKEIDIQVQEAQRIPSKKDAKRTTLRHIIIKMPKFKYRESISKAAREKQKVIYKGVSIRLPTDFSKETWQARRVWQEEFKVMKSKDLSSKATI